MAVYYNYKSDKIRLITLFQSIASRIYLKLHITTYLIY